MSFLLVTTDPVTDLGITKARFNSHYSGDEYLTEIYFQYKQGIDGDVNMWSRGGTFPFESSFSYYHTNFLPHKVYYFRAGATRSSDPVTWGGWLSFTTESPIVQTLPATDIETTEAKLWGLRNTDYLNWVTPVFYWKKGISGTVTQIWLGSTYGDGERLSSWLLRYLIPDSTYYYRFALQMPNGGEWFDGDWVKFVTQFPADVITEAATNIKNYSAQINGEVIPGQDEIVERGFYWKKGATGSVTTFIVGSGGGTYSKELTGLSHGTLYYFQAYGEGDSGEFYYGDWLSFTTTSVVPTVSTQIATDIEQFSVTGNGTIVSIGGGEPFCSKRGFEVKYEFSGTLNEYNAWTNHGFAGDITLNSLTGLWEGTLIKSYEETGEFLVGIFALNLDDLVCDKEFLYRARAENTAGWGYGSYLAFTTDDLLTRKTCTLGVWTIMLCAVVKPIPSSSIIKRRGFRWGVYNTAQEYDIHEDGDFSASAIIGPKTISFVNSADDSVYDTIIDSAGGFLSAGFVAGKFIDVSATGALSIENEGQFKIISVTANTITVNVRNTLVSESITGVTIVDLFALYIVDLDPETDYYSVAYVAIEDSEGNWTVHEGNVAMATTIINPFDFEGYDKVEFYKPEREQNYKKITRKIEAEIISEQQYIEKAGGRRFLDIKNHLIQTKANAVVIGTNYRDRFQEIKSLMGIEFPTSAPFQREDTLDIGFGRIRFKLDDKGIVNFMPDGEGLMLFRYRMVMMIRKNDMGYTISKDNVDYMATMELEEA